jgi:Protein of unknown function (DUF4236)
MGLRFRRSWGVLPGVRFNLGLKSGSVSFGVRGLHYTVGTRGSQVTAGIPRTGLFWTTRITLPFGRSPQLPLPQTHSPHQGGGIQQLRQPLGGGAQSPPPRQPQTYSPPNRGGAPPQQVRQPQTYLPPIAGATPLARSNPIQPHVRSIGGGRQSSPAAHTRIFVPLWLAWTALAAIAIAGLCIMAGIFGALVR